MKAFGKNWSKVEAATLVGAVAGILVIPAAALLVPGEFAPREGAFSQAASADLDPHEGTCLDDLTQVIPAGTAVCATLHGAWLDGIGPLGLDKQEAMAIWTRQAHPPFLVLTTPHPYRHPERLQESIEFVVCVKPPGGAERAKHALDRMHIDVVRSPSVARSSC